VGVLQGTEEESGTGQEAAKCGISPAMTAY